MKIFLEKDLLIIYFFCCNVGPFHLNVRYNDDDVGDDADTPAAADSAPTTTSIHQQKSLQESLRNIPII